jgi:uncharacterized phiE125 gp8 family phage protein
MLLSPIRIAGPAVSSVSLAEAKLHLRIDGDDEDTLVEALVDAAVQYLDGWSGILGRCLISQQWQVSLGSWPFCPLRLPFPGISSVSVGYLDTDGADQSVDGSLFQTYDDARGTVLAFRSAFTSPSLQDERTDAVTIAFTAGYGDGPEDIPAPIRAAILLLVGHWYQNREAVNVGNIVTELPFAVRSLIEPFRRVGI